MTAHNLLVPWKKVMCFSNNMRVSKWWQNFYFGV